MTANKPDKTKKAKDTKPTAGIKTPHGTDMDYKVVPLKVKTAKEVDEKKKPTKGKK